MDITETLAPTSDQLDAIELVAGPRTFQIERVTPGSAEQPINVHLKDFPRPWRPGKGMRRVLAACWGADASKWPGRSVTLFFDPEVTFGKEKPGGTRISHLSHIDAPKRIPLLVSRGKSAIYTVEPLLDTPPTTSAADAATPQQIARIGALMRPAGLDRDGILRFAAETIGRPVKSSSDLTAAEAGAVIDALEPLVTDPAKDPDPWATTAADIDTRDDQETAP